MRLCPRGRHTPGWYQIGELQALSWIVFGTCGSVHAGGRSAAGNELQAYVLQRQLGFSTTRA